MLRPSTALIVIAVVVMAVGMAGCESVPSPARMGYSVPAGGAPATESVVVAQPPDRVFRNLVDRLQQQATVEVPWIDEQGRHLVVEYSGDPEPFVDCGTITMRQSGGEDRMPAATAEASMIRYIGSSGDRRGENVVVYRNLRLDSRMLVSVQPDRDGSRVAADAVYVLTKTINVGSKDGSRGQRRETITFGTGESGRFARQTTCRPSGQLERLATDSLPEGTVTAQPATPITSTPTTTAGPNTGAQTGAAATPADAGGAARPMVAATPDATPPTATAPTAAPTSAGATPATEGAAVAGLGTVGVAGTTGAAAAMTADPATTRATPQTAITAAPAASLDAALADLAAITCGLVDHATTDAEVRLIGQVGEPGDVERLRAGLAQAAGGRRIDTSQLEVVYWPFCEVLEVMATYAGRDLAVTTATGSALLVQGDPLTLEVRLPGNAAYLYMGYIQTDGRVGYIATMSVREWAKVGRIRFRTGYEVGPPFGREMIVAVVSERPLFTDARPAYEPAEEYLAALRQALARIGAAGSAVEAAHLFIVTQAGQGS